MAKRDRPEAAAIPRRSRYDWTAIKAQFVAGDMSLREFARAVGIPPVTIRREASKSGWTAAREVHRARVATRTEARIVERKAAAEAEIDGAAHRFALLAMEKAEAMLRRKGRRSVQAGGLKALTAAHREAYEQARIAAHLTPAPVPQPEGAEQTRVIVRTRDEFGVVTERDAGSPAAEPVAPPDGGPRGLPADADAGAVPAVPLP